MTPTQAPRDILNIHSTEKTHRGNKRTFRCNQCNSSFNRSAHLKRHHQTHRAEKPFTCSYCPVSSSRKDVITRHTRNFHPEQLQNPGVRDTVADTLDLDAGALPEHNLPPTAGGSPHSPTDPELRTHNDPNLHDQPCITSQPVRKTPSHGHEMDCENLTANFEPVGLGTYDFDFVTFHERNRTPENLLGFLSPSALDNINQWELFASDLQLPPSGQFTTVYNEGASLRADTLEPPVHDSPSSDADSHLDGPVGLDIDDYQRLRANLALFDTGHGLETFRFPSRYAVCRYVTAFFDRMATHFPIIHRPTFDITKVPGPLLLEILASGALYSREHDIANSLNAAALHIMSEHKRLVMPGKRENRFQLWIFQLNLLASYFTAYNETHQLGQNMFPLLSRSVKLSEEAVSELRPSGVNTYTHWVYQESICRCIAGTIILTAAINSSATKQLLHFLDLNIEFPLPSRTSAWLNDGSSWDGSSVEASSFSDAMANILAGEKPNIKISSFSLLTIVAAFLSHICSFEAVASSQHADLYTGFVNKMEKSVQLLNEMWNAQAARTSHECGENVTSHAPLMKAARSLLDSAVFHLYGSCQLGRMKHLLDNTIALGAPNEFEKLFLGPFPASLNKALISAAKSWRSDIRRGLRYLQRVCAHRIAPLSCRALLEGSLLLCWYLEINRSDPTTAAGKILSVELLLGESIAELDGLGVAEDTEVPLLPLIAAADLLGDDASVWQWPVSLAGKIRQLIEQLKDMHTRRRNLLRTEFTAVPHS